MSLVAYGSSDDSDESDQEEAHVPSKPVESTSTPVIHAQGIGGSLAQDSAFPRSEDPPISDEDDDDFMVTDQPHPGLTLPPPKHEHGFGEATVTEQKQLSVLQDLPKPKSSIADTGLVDRDEGELEDFVKRSQFEVKKEQLPVSTENVAAKKRKLIQITVPEVPVDSDEEEENNKKQRTSNSVDTSKKKCGLFDVLPAPKNESLAKDIGKRSIPSTVIKNEETTSMETESTTQTEVSAKTKIFVPTSVSRKSKQSSQSAFNLDTGIMMPKKIPKPNTKPIKATSGEATKDSVEHSGKPAQVSLVSVVPDDSDEEEGEGHSNFFSLNPEEKANQEKEDLSASSYVATASVSSLPAVTKQKPQKEVEQDNLQKPEPLTFSGTAGPELQDAPLQFKNSTTNSYSLGGYSGGTGDSSYSGQLYGNAAYNYANVEAEDMDVTEEMETESAGEMEGILHDKEFLKLQGKGKHGAEEINFIDVHQDDQISNIDVMKGLTEETGMMSHSKKKNKDMPSSQQKKKHQITYLAFRAKERELELKNQWADNRATKKQTQAKYGF